MMKKKLTRLFSILLLFTVLFSGCQGNTKTPAHRLEWWLDEIHWNEKRNAYDGSGIKVAVIDTGIDRSHPDLKNKITAEYRVPSLGEPPQDQPLEHGTAVAGVIAAYPADGNGVLGVAPGVGILSIDVTDDQSGEVSATAAIEGIRYAVEANVDIINISLGFRNSSSELELVVRQALEKGIILVASAGNHMEDDVLYPAKMDGVFCVGARDKEGKIISPVKADKTVTYLPGEYIVTTCSGDKRYISMKGTSIATPILTGCIALALQKDPDCTADKIAKILRETVIFDVSKFLEKV